MRWPPIKDKMDWKLYLNNYKANDLAFLKKAFQIWSKYKHQNYDDLMLQMKQLNADEHTIQFIVQAFQHSVEDGQSFVEKLIVSSSI